MQNKYIKGLSGFAMVIIGTALYRKGIEQVKEVLGK